MPARRHSQSGALRLVPALRAAIVVALIATVAVGYVAEKNKLIELSRQITAREAKLDRLLAENRQRAGQIEDLLLPQRLAERVRELRLGLAPAAATQKVWLPEPAEGRPSNAPQDLLVLKK